MVDGLSGKIVLVTGASSGIGRTLALALAKNGCTVVAAARRIPNLLALRHEIEGFGGKVGIVELDVRADDATIDKYVETAWNKFEGIDVLINNAGIRGSVHSPIDYGEDEWQTVFDTNLKGLWLMSKAVGRRMRANNRNGSIINISSITGLERGLAPGNTIYGTSKAAANHITKYLALELGQFNIRVNSIASGLFKTEITAGLFSTNWVEHVGTRIVPMGRWGNIDPDLTSLVLLLSSDSSLYITGNVFIVDGGNSIPSVPIWSSL